MGSTGTRLALCVTKTLENSGHEGSHLGGDKRYGSVHGGRIPRPITGPGVQIVQQ